jgi:uncharacterized delta-60 repeat protein
VALATGVFCPAAIGDPGDLDPTFGDVGRVETLSGLNGTAASLALQNDDVIIAGGEAMFNPIIRRGVVRGFVSRLTDSGQVDSTFAAGLSGVQVFDIEVSHQRVVGVGRRILGSRSLEYLVFRLEPDGRLDTSFGTDGIQTLSDISGATSVALDDADKVVIAASSGAALKVLRLMPDGTPDSTFGSAGVFTALPDTDDENVNAAPRILSLKGGGYRVTDNDYRTDALTSRCRVLALTTEGTVDETFGTAGYAVVGPDDGANSCDSLLEISGERLLVGGSTGAEPLLVRLGASGATDTTFGIDDLGDTSMTRIAALATDPNDGAVLVAGYGPGDVPGTMVARLQPDGALDAGFGVNGATWIDLATSTSPIATELAVLPNGDTLVTGSTQGFRGSPFLARLAQTGVDGPGVLGVKIPGIDTREAQDVAVTVRRMGGRTGAVGVAYRTLQTGEDAFSAREGDDYTPQSGRLEWPDGDDADQQISITIPPHSGASEEVEYFTLELSAPSGGAGMGTNVATITIASDAPAGGMFAIEQIDSPVGEDAGVAQFYVSRNYSYTGAVSVTVTPASDTATAGDDFTGTPVTITWADGDAEWKLAEIPITDDTTEEPQESFSLQLSDPTGGTLIGPRSTGTIEIAANDAPPPPSPPPSDTSDGGGGCGGWGALLLLALSRLRRLTAGQLHD